MVPGLTGKSEMIVKEEDLVSKFGAVEVDALSTPRLIQLIEAATIDTIREFISSDQLTIGTELRIKHISPTPLGMKVIAHALLKEVNNNRLIFLVDAYDEAGKVAEGEHERIILFKEEFFEKVNNRKR